MNAIQNGKGSKPRPIKLKQYENNYDLIDWGHKKTYTTEGFAEFMNDQLSKSVETLISYWMTDAVNTTKEKDNINGKQNNSTKHK